MTKIEQPAVAADDGERIAKYLARAGVCSRRDAERLIAEGKVKINGKTLDSPAVKVSGQERIEVEGRVVATPQKARLWRFYKPLGLVVSHKDEQGRQTVFDWLKTIGLPRVVSIGRLDLNSEGLLLLTNDGGLARQLELPSNGWVRRYRVRLAGYLDRERLERLKHGITIDGVRYGPIEVEIDRTGGVNSWAYVSLTEGKNREIRRVMEHLGLGVNRLIREAYGPFDLNRLQPGEAVPVAQGLVDKLMAGEIPLTGSLEENSGRPPAQSRPTAPRPIAARTGSPRTSDGPPRKAIAKPDADDRPKRTSGPVKPTTGKPTIGKPTTAKAGPGPKGTEPKGYGAKGAGPKGPAPKGSGPKGNGPQGSRPTGAGPRPAGKPTSPQGRDHAHRRRP